MACICLLAAGIILSTSLPQSPQPSTTGKPTDPQSITVFYTANELGAMKPCGCSGSQLGGLDRRDAVFSTVPPENRLILDTGDLVPESSEQNLIKFNIITQAFGLLGYDVVNLTEQDTIIARQAGLLDVIRSLFDCITPASPDDFGLPSKFSKSFTLNDSTVNVTVAVIDSDEQIPRLGELFSAPDACMPVSVNILILKKADTTAIEAVSSKHLVDCLIVPPQSDEPMLVRRGGLIGNTDGKPLIVSEGRIGKYVGKILISLPIQSGRPQLSFSSVPVTEDLTPSRALVELYKNYQHLVKEAGLLEKYPRFVLSDGLEYVGSKSCKLCHDYEYEKWMTSPPVILPDVAPAKRRHANAYATLEEIGSDYDPECVICHVVGMRYESGFITPAKTPELKDVGCENCHGPGSEHLRSLGAVETSGPISTCTDCHTTEHSADYAANEKQYFEKIIHWREPVSAVRVKEPNRPAKTREPASSSNVK